MKNGHDADNVFTMTKLRPFQDQRSEQEKIDDALEKQNAVSLDDAANDIEERLADRDDAIDQQTTEIADEIMERIRNIFRGNDLYTDHPNMWKIYSLVAETVELGIRSRDHVIAADLIAMIDAGVLDDACEKFDPADFEAYVEGKGWVEKTDDAE